MREELQHAFPQLLPLTETVRPSSGSGSKPELSIDLDIFDPFGIILLRMLRYLYRK